MNGMLIGARLRKMKITEVSPLDPQVSLNSLMRRAEAGLRLAKQRNALICKHTIKDDFAFGS
jgi:hypothetical protein